MSDKQVIKFALPTLRGFDLRTLCDNREGGKKETLREGRDSLGSAERAVHRELKLCSIR